MSNESCSCFEELFSELCDFKLTLPLQALEAVAMDEDIEDYVEQVRDIIRDVLPGKKYCRVTQDQILETVAIIFAQQLSLTTTSGADTNQTEDYQGRYYPVEIVDKAVITIVDGMKEDGLDDGDTDDDDESGYSDDGLTWTKDLLKSLAVVYPDIDLKYLLQTLDRFQGDPNMVQHFLENNLDVIPEKRVVQAVHFNLLSSTCDYKAEKPWQCPQCR